MIGDMISPTSELTIAKGGTDDHPDGEIDGVSPQSKFLEFLDHVSLRCLGQFSVALFTIPYPH